MIVPNKDGALRYTKSSLGTPLYCTYHELRSGWKVLPNDFVALSLKLIIKILRAK